MGRLDDRNALVTGGAQGLGRAIARRLAGEGAKVTIVDLNEDKAAECVGLIERDGGERAGGAEHGGEEGGLIE